MNNDIYINREVLQDKVTKLRDEKKKIENSFSKIKSDTEGMIEYWSGDSGEKAYDTLSNYTKKFNDITDMLEKYIRFIEETLKAYDKMDQLINKKMEENANIEAF